MSLIKRRKEKLKNHFVHADVTAYIKTMSLKLYNSTTLYTTLLWFTVLVQRVSVHNV